MRKYELKADRLEVVEQQTRIKSFTLGFLKKALVKAERALSRQKAILEASIEEARAKVDEIKKHISEFERLKKVKK